MRANRAPMFGLTASLHLTNHWVFPLYEFSIYRSSFEHGWFHDARLSALNQKYGGCCFGVWPLDLAPSSRSLLACSATDKPCVLLCLFNVLSCCFCCFMMLFFLLFLQAASKGNKHFRSSSVSHRGNLGNRASINTKESIVMLECNSSSTVTLIRADKLWPPPPLTL